MRFITLVLFALVLGVGLVSAQYYADVELTVAPDGTTTVSGVSNVPALQEGTTQELTSKKGERWLFNLTIPETLDDFVVKIHLPQGATLNYVSAKSGLDISSENDVITITRVGSNSDLALVIQYKIVSKQKAILGSVLLWLLLVGIISVIAAVARKSYSMKQKRKAVQVQTKTQNPNTIAPEVMDSLPERQREILLLLVKASQQTLTQKQLEERINIPKSSVSRNIDALVRRGLITKNQAGMTNTISLHERFRA